MANINFIRIATEVFLGNARAQDYETLELPYVGVKAPHFSYRRLKGADPVATVEMASTGEVACIGETLSEAFLCAWKAAENKIQTKSVFLSLGSNYAKAKLGEGIRAIEHLGWELYATEGTQEYLSQKGVGCYFVYKLSDGLTPTLLEYILQNRIGVIINIPRANGHDRGTDGYAIRRLAIDHSIPLITNVQSARIFLKSISEFDGKKIPVRSWQDYVRNSISVFSH